MILKRLLFGIAWLIIICTWFLWFAPYWIITGGEPFDAFIIFDDKYCPRSKKDI